MTEVHDVRLPISLGTPKPPVNAELLSSLYFPDVLWESTELFSSLDTLVRVRHEGGVAILSV